MSNCDYCLYYVYDEEFDEYICSAAGDMDEDDYVRFQTGTDRSCRYYRPGDEYTIVRKQN